MNRQLPGDSYWAREGDVLAGPYPGAPTDSEARAKLTELLEFGVTCFVDLTEEGEGPPLRPYAHLLKESLGARYVRMPIRDVSIPLAWQMRATLETIDQAVAAGEVVYLHCWGGVGRTGTVVGCLLVEGGFPRDSVLGDIAELRAHTDRVHKESPETDEQRDFVLAWRSEREGVAGVARR